MRTIDLVTSAVANTFRAKTRTALTVVAIFVGAFTLSLTTGLGTGINAYVDETLSSLGATDVMTVTKPTETGMSQGPREYDPDSATTTTPGGAPGAMVEVMTVDDLDVIAEVDGVEGVEPVLPVELDYVQHADGTRYVAGFGTVIAGQQLQLAAGEQPDDGDPEALAIPVGFVEPLGFDDADDAIGAVVTLALTDAEGLEQAVEATVVGVAEETFSLSGADSLLPSAALTRELFDVQNVGVADEDRERYQQAMVWFDGAATAEELDLLQENLSDAGYQSQTVEQQLGAFTAVIDGIILVLNGFAIIALLAASFGIVNTLLMSVQERTREIGLMKAMGMGSGRVFALFSIEAAFIGFLGSGLGVVVAILVGGVASRVVGNTLLSDLPGLQLIAFDPIAVAALILMVMAIAFLAGTIPALRAARQDPVTSLRYE